MSGDETEERQDPQLFAITIVHPRQTQFALKKEMKMRERKRREKKKGGEGGSYELFARLSYIDDKKTQITWNLHVEKKILPCDVLICILYQENKPRGGRAISFSSKRLVYFMFFHDKNPSQKSTIPCYMLFNAFPCFSGCFCPYAHTMQSLPSAYP
jgi:hypothetical protein